MFGLALMAALAVSPAERNLVAEIPSILEKSAAHYRALDAAATPLMEDGKGGWRFPRSWTAEKGVLMRGVNDWTSGHYAGALWYLFEGTGDVFFRDRAVVWTEVLAGNAKRDNTHDLGFIMFCSYGNARRLLKTDRYDAILRETSDSLCKRYNPELGLIRSWGKIDEKKDFLVIPDNLMNLEMLEEVAKFSGEKRFAEVARSHADVTMKHHFRADGGTYHVLNYNQKDGRVQEIRRGQGLQVGTAWARGQSWAIYGYSMMFRETGDRRYLDFAMKLSDFAIAHPNMPADGVPYWDYGAPGEERDTSAAAIMASALLELSQVAPEGKAQVYRDFAVKQIASLATPAYFSTDGEIGHFLLKHGVGNKPGHSEIDVPLNYGDYYFLEAVIRLRNLSGATR